MAEESRTLYHYTNFRGLEGILRTRSLWATDIRYLNDANELVYGVSEMSALLAGIAEEMPDLAGDDLVKYGTLHKPGENVTNHKDPNALGPANRAVNAAAAMLAALVDPSLPQMPLDWKWGNGYVTCLSARPDSLGQWRGYAGGDGFAIGFDRARLGQLTVKGWDYKNGAVDAQSDRWLDLPVPAPQAVLYGDEARDSTMGDVKGLLEKFISSNDKVVPYTHFATQVFTIAMRLCAILKDGAFEEEDEWRLVVHDAFTGKLEFRPGSRGNGGVVPFRRIGFPTESISNIVIGPGSASELRERAVHQLLESYGFGYNRVKVVHSQVPFRD
ncbi:DUF2971 domain-containing protein [Rhodococcus sp. NBC_00294]|uniref:DUF2971 domain-containing protein n=1 Tax=Rhodococcus sp. NBC_00294 TaxID=2976004 RepID=UPI002E2DD0F5|nr:DUF2971 domain-containing protein [Rhodococcus sp. NBC_00294]